MLKEFFCSNVEQTQKLAFCLGKLLQDGDFIQLNGQIGAGKTSFVKGLALGLGFGDDITSPTFNIMNEYNKEDVTLKHFDLYRLQTESELDETGFFEYIEQKGIKVVEWSDLFVKFMPEQSLVIEIKVLPFGRHIIFKANGQRYTSICEELENADFRG